MVYSDKRKSEEFELLDEVWRKVGMVVYYLSYIASRRNLTSMKLMSGEEGGIHL